MTNAKTSPAATSVEFARIRLAPGATEAALLEASDAFQRDFLDQTPGFVRRELLRTGPGEFADLVHWTSADAAAAAMQAASASAATGACFGLMVFDDPNAGVLHGILLARYD